MVETISVSTKRNFPKEYQVAIDIWKAEKPTKITAEGVYDKLSDRGKQRVSLEGVADVLEALCKLHKGNK